MRKHFLILMLLTLLPLAGFAADLDFSKIAISNHEYGTGTALTCTVQGGVYTEGDDKDFVVDYAHFYTDEACTTIAKKGDTPYTLATLPVNTYYLKVTGKGVYLTSNGVVSFRVYGVNVFIDFNAGQEKAFGAENPAYTYALTDSKDDPFDNTDNKLALTVGRVPGENAGDYEFTFTATNPNYLVSRKSGDTDKFTIAPKTFAKPAITLTVAEADLTYNASNQAPTITVKDGETPLVLNTDYTISYMYSIDNKEAYADAAANKNAGYYKVIVKGKGNYSAGTIEADDPFQIKQAPLNVYANDYHKAYNGDALIPDEVTAGYSGLQGTDATTENLFGADPFDFDYVTTLADAGNKWTTETGYPLSVTPKLATEALPAYKNYKVLYLNTGKLFVDKVAITVKPSAGQYKSFGEADPEFTVAAPAGAVAGDVATITASYTVTRSGVGTDEAVGVYKNVLSVSKKSGLKPAAENILAQYTITLGTEDFEIIKSGLYVYPKNVTVKYGDDYDVADFEVVASTDKGATVALTATPTVKFKGENQHPTVPGTYVLELEGDAAADGYDAPIIMEGQFIIEKRALTIKPLPQVLHVGDKVTNLNNAKVEFTNKVGDDVIGYKLEFNTAGDGSIGTANFTDGDATKALLDAAKNKTFAKAIKITLVGSTKENPNVNEYYVITSDATAALTVGDVNDINFLADNDDWTEIVKFDGKTATSVTLKNREDQGIGKFAGDWKAEEWNTIILPFKTSARKISAAFGYAIVNVVNPAATTTGNVQFKIQMKGDIPANTPIAIKTDADIAAGDIIDFGDIDGEKIVKPADKKVEVEAGAGHKFVGVYETTKIDKTTPNYHFLVNGGWKHIGASSKNTFNIVPFNCYLDQSNAASASELTITFEEIDGSFTAIKAVESDAISSSKNAVKNAGWYTINGMKLDAAPAQKGIYIYNGKKYVVK